MHGKRRRNVRIKTQLRGVGLRPTRQRVALTRLLFAKGARHLTADVLFREAKQVGADVSLATVYNVLHDLVEKGLVREIAIDTWKSQFDTNVSDHHHFYFESTRDLIDIPPDQVRISEMPEPPIGCAIIRVDVVIRLTKN